jgi:hypothetical protein
MNNVRWGKRHENDADFFHSGLPKTHLAFAAAILSILSILFRIRLPGSCEARRA